jgi:hypothetical protein
MEITEYYAVTTSIKELRSLGISEKELNKLNYYKPSESLEKLKKVLKIPKKFKELYCFEHDYFADRNNIQEEELYVEFLHERGKKFNKERSCYEN